LLGGLVAAVILAVLLVEGAGSAQPHHTVQIVQANNFPCVDCP
jgi:hypothetical protein